MDSSQDQAIWTFSNEFSSKFRSARLELETRIAEQTSPNAETTKALSVDIAKLAKSLANAAGSLPSYDQKLYETQLKALEESLNELHLSTVAKPKFSFKRRPAPAPGISSNPADKSPKKTPLPTSSPLPSINSSISNHKYTYLGIDSLVGQPPTSDLTISDLDYCIVNLLPTDDTTKREISTIHLNNVSNSVLLLPIINGSVLIYNLSRCIIVIGGHQFRMHASTKIDVFISITSNPIIEDCRDIQFSTYPRDLLPQHTELSIEPSAVQDFSHIRNTPSPNWALMDSSSTKRQWPTERIQSVDELDSSLQKILPQ